MSKKTKKKDEVLPSIIGAVLYADGSAKPNPGYGGWGIHGYTYDLNQVVQPSKTQMKNIVTNLGYKAKADLKDEGITTHRKIDTITAYGTAPSSRPHNNNEMELLALKKGFELGVKYQWKQLAVYSDSQAAINSVSHWYDRWEKSNWLKQDGTPVKMQPEIKATYQAKLAYESIGDLSLFYIKGHAGFLGNEMADTLAKKGSTLHQHGKVTEVVEVGDPPTKTKPDFHDLLTKNRWYFMGGKQHLGQPLKLHDKYAYFIGTLGDKKKDENFGMHMADGFAGIVLLPEEEPILNRIQTIYRQNCEHDYDFVVVGNLDTALTAANYHDIVSGNQDLIIQDKQKKVLALPNERVVCMEYNPAHLSYIHMLRYERLIELLGYYMDSKLREEKLTVTDVTSYFVQVDTKVSKKKEETKLYSLIKAFSKQNFVKATIHYTKLDGKQGSCTIKLTNKTDVPDKMHLARLIKTYGAGFKMSVITLPMSSESLIHATIVEVPDAIGIWTNFDSSVVFLYEGNHHV